MYDTYMSLYTYILNFCGLSLEKTDHVIQIGRDGYMFAYFGGSRLKGGYYWATPTGEAQFKIRSFICVRNGIPMGRLFCCTISLALSRSLRDVQLTWRAVIGFNWK